jgi:hypothetical protein
VSQWPIVLPAELSKRRVLFDEGRLAAALRGAKDGPLTLMIERAYATRSAKQNAWYWGQILKLIDGHTGQGIDDLHEFFKLKFNPHRVIVTDHNGVIVGDERIGQTTTRLNRMTFGEYCEEIRRWALDELSVVIPDPDPAWREARQS